MPVSEVLGILVLGGIVGLWLDSLRAREAAIRAARAICAAEGVMLLDDTVAISGLKLARDEGARITLQRTYDFEFSDTGNNRLKGDMVLHAHRVVLINVGIRMLH